MTMIGSVNLFNGNGAIEGPGRFKNGIVRVLG